MELKGKQKVAAYLLGLDTQAAADIIRSMEDYEVALISKEMLKLKNVDGKTLQAVRKEFEEKAASGVEAGISDTSSVTVSLLEAALGEEESKKILGGKGPKAPQRSPFETLNDLDPDQLAALLMGEHPQVIAVVMSYIKPHLAAAILSELPDEGRPEIIVRMTKRQAASHELLSDIEMLLCQKADNVSGSTASSSSEATCKTVADILNMVGKKVRKGVLDHLGEDEPETAAEIESMMFVFEDLAQIDDRAMQRVLREIDNQTLTLALKSASDEIKERVMDNLSKRATESIKEEMEMMGPKPISKVEGAQREILEEARKLDEAGEIALRQNEQEAMV